jgi:hypothetical protein
MMSLFNQAVQTMDRFQEDVEIVEKNGEQRAIIKYYDPMWSGLGFEAGKKTPNLDYDVAIFGDFDKRHTESEFGTIYCTDGKTMLKPVIYPGDHIYVGGKDVTSQLREPTVSHISLPFVPYMGFIRLFY